MSGLLSYNFLLADFLTEFVLHPASSYKVYKINVLYFQVKFGKQSIVDAWRNNRQSIQKQSKQINIPDLQVKKKHKKVQKFGQGS